ncbi:MAG: Wzz/FepE/Etk N-terminal domain-containing protein [Synergistaceae bacterium]|nr:Wzz/FepE/Etk N-terminal domain-containing protein [Synergistaceae bacterium]
MSNYSSEQELYPENCDEEMSILDILIVLAEQKKLIIGTVLLFTLAGLLYAFFITEPKYSSEVQMMPLTSSVLDNGDFAVQVPVNIVGAVIMSNATLDAVIDEFGLLKTKGGGSQSRIIARRELEKDIKVDINKDSVITLKVDASEPETAMKMAGFIYNKTVGTLEDIGITATVSNKDAYLEWAIKKKINEIEKKSSDGGGSPKITSLLDLYTMLTKYDEISKIIDRSPTVIRLISPASLPDEEAPQGRGKIVALSALLGLFCAVMLAFARHFWKSSDEDAATAEKKKRLRMLLRS